MEIILASNSSRRKEIFSRLFPTYRSLSPDCAELSSEQYGAGDVEFFTLQNAQMKGNAIFEKKPIQYGWIISCDTAIATLTHIIGKPTSEYDAIEMLKKLSGTTHRVVSTVAMIRIRDHYSMQRICFSDTTFVTFTPLSDDDMLSYMQTYRPFDKAGGYGIQEVPSHFIASVDGSVWNVVGFPIEKFCKKMQYLDVQLSKEKCNEFNSLNRGQ
jgi:septum formation protein